MSQMVDAVGGVPLVIHWRLIGHVFFTWEIAMEAVEKILPARLEAVEVRPGVGLMSVGCLRFARGHFSPDSPEFNEIITVVHVQPDLSVKMPPPRFTFYANSVWSDSDEFVVHEARDIFTPTSHVPSLRLEFSDDGLGIEASDAHGPLLSLRSTAPVTAFTRAEFWGQHYNATKGLHHGIWQWEGSRFEHMKPGEPGKLAPHALFGDLDVSKVRRCYRQMFAEPGRRHSERFFQVRRLD